MAKSQYAPSPEDCDLVDEMHQYADDILSAREHSFINEVVNVCIHCGSTKVENTTMMVCNSCLTFDDDTDW